MAYFTKPFLSASLWISTNGTASGWWEQIW